MRRCRGIRPAMGPMHGRKLGWWGGQLVDEFRMSQLSRVPTMFGALPARGVQLLSAVFPTYKEQLNILHHISVVVLGLYTHTDIMLCMQ